MTASKIFGNFALQAIVALGGLLAASTSVAQVHGGAGRVFGGGFGGGFGSGAWTYCTQENTICNIAGVNDVAYGYGNSWTYAQNVRGPVSCTNSAFGDPLPGIVKECWYRASSGPGGPGGRPGGGGGGRRDVIRVQSATYGGNVRAGYNNAFADVAQKCNALRACDYLISTRYLGDPAFGRGKDFVVEFTCDRTPQRPVVVRAEANGQIARLRCN